MFLVYTVYIKSQCSKKKKHLLFFYKYTLFCSRLMCALLLKKYFIVMFVSVNSLIRAHDGIVYREEKGAFKDVSAETCEKDKGLQKPFLRGLPCTLDFKIND